MLGNILSRRWRKASEYKKLLQQLQSQLKQLKNKKQAVSRILRNDIAQLIGNNDQTRALVRTKELLIVENSISVYGLLLQFTDVILLKFDHSIKRQRFGKELLDDKINEAVSSLVFASTRCGEELLQPLLFSIRKIFAQRYGQLYVSTALELRHGNFVNLKIKEKLSLDISDSSEDMSVGLLNEISKESGLEDMLRVEYYTPEIEKHVIYVEEEKSELEEETSMEDENMEDAQKEEEDEDERRRRRPLPKHVHPKLPDYDQIVAKIIRAKIEDEEERRRSLLPKHVHPKLPDYDQIVDKFKALRT